MMKGWHFVGEKLRDGSPVPPDGEWLVHKGEVKICQSGFHYSERILDALNYAPGSTICRVEVRDVVEQHSDKNVARERRILWRIDGEELLREFARKCALDAIRLWDAPAVVLEYRSDAPCEARDAVRLAVAAAEAAAGDPALAYVPDVVRYSVQMAARDSAWDVQNKRLEAMVREARQ